MLTRPRDENDPPLHGGERWKPPEAIGPDEWLRARSSPDCIVTDYLYADVGVLVAPGGVGKTTLQLFEAVHIALGRPLYGLTVRKPGPVLILTAEDSREMLVARLRAICADMGLSNDEVRRVRELVRISDVSGNGLRLTEVVADVVMPCETIDDLVRGCLKLAPVLIVIDPAVSFGVGESRVNDAEQGLIEAGRKLRNALNCCVRYIHHSGKNNARDRAVDQYAGRGGSAFADGARMVHVLQPLTPDEWRTETGQSLEPGSTALMLARPKMSYCPPQGPLYIKRTGYRYEAIEPLQTDAEAIQRERGDKVLAAIRQEIERGHFPTRHSLEGADTGLSRQQLRQSLAWLESAGMIEERKRPDAGSRGARTYLHPATGEATANRGNDDPASPPENIIPASPPPIGKTPAANRPACFPPDPIASPATTGEATAKRRSDSTNEAATWL